MKTIFTTAFFILTLVLTLRAQSIPVEVQLSRLEDQLYEGKISSQEFKKQSSKLCPSIRQRSPLKSLLDSVQYWDYDPITSDYLIKSKFIYLYSGLEYPSIVDYYDFDFSLNQLYLFSKSERSYNSQGLITELIRKTWNSSTKKIENRIKYAFSYKLNGNWIQDLYYRWNATKNDWENYARYDYTYNSSNDLVESLNYIWNESTTTWVVNSRNTHIINSLHLDSILLNENWDTNLKQWIPYSKSNTFYNLEGLLTLDSTFNSFIVNDWKLGEVINYSYDSKGNQILRNEQVYDNSLMKLIPSFMYETSYDSFRSVINYKTSTWNQSDLKWEVIINSRYQNSYNSDNKIEKIIAYNVDEPSSAEYLSGKDLYFYSQHDVLKTIDVQENIDMQIVPNPFSDFIQLKNIRSIGDLNVISLTGERICSFSNLDLSKPVPLSYLNTGSYFLQIKTEQRLITKLLFKN